MWTVHDTTTKTYLHYDLDAFFAAVEAALDPRLAVRPAVVVGHGKRAVICCANYPARRLGLRAAQPAYTAQLPGVETLTVRPEAYRRVGDKAAALFGELGELRRESIDEATILLSAPLDVARIEHLRARLRDEYGLSVSIGVASSRTLAKMASEKAKPGGLVVVTGAETTTFLESSAVGSIPGCGPKTVERLAHAGLTTGADIARSTERDLARLVGEAMARRLKTVVAGGDPAEGPRRHQISSGTTFDDDLPADRAPAICEELLSKAWVRAGTVDEVTLSVKRAAGTRSRSRRLTHPTTSHERVQTTLRRLIEDVGQDPIAGLTVTLGTTDAPAQAELFEPETGKNLETTREQPDISDVLHRGMRLEHTDFGPGTVHSAANGAVRIRFSDRERLLEINSLDGRWVDLETAGGVEQTERPSEALRAVRRSSAHR